MTLEVCSALMPQLDLCVPSRSNYARCQQHPSSAAQMPFFPARLLLHFMSPVLRAATLVTVTFRKEYHCCSACRGGQLENPYTASPATFVWRILEPFVGSHAGTTQAKSRRQSTARATVGKGSTWCNNMCGFRLSGRPRLQHCPTAKQAASKLVCSSGLPVCCDKPKDPKGRTKPQPPVWGATRERRQASRRSCCKRTEAEIILFLHLCAYFPDTYVLMHDCWAHAVPVRLNLDWRASHSASPPARPNTPHCQPTPAGNNEAWTADPWQVLGRRATCAAAAAAAAAASRRRPLHLTAEHCSPIYAGPGKGLLPGLLGSLPELHTLSWMMRSLRRRSLMSRPCLHKRKSLLPSCPRLDLAGLLPLLSLAGSLGALSRARSRSNSLAPSRRLVHTSMPLAIVLAWMPWCMLCRLGAHMIRTLLLFPWTHPPLTTASAASRFFRSSGPSLLPLRCSHLLGSGWVVRPPSCGSKAPPLDICAKPKALSKGIL